MEKHKNQKNNFFVFFILFLVIFIYIFAGLRIIPTQSMTHDEHQYFVSGLYYLKYHDLRFNRVSPPLAKYIYALPLLHYNLNLPRADEQYIETHFDNREYAIDLFKQNPALFFPMLYSSRTVTVFFQIIGILAIFFLGMIMYSPFAGVISAILYAFSLPLFAHSTLATLDIPLTASLIIFYIFFYLLIKKPKIPMLIATAVSLGMAISVKFPALLFIPIVLFILFFIVKTWKKIIFYTGIFLATLFLVIFTIYGFEMRPLIDKKIPPHSCQKKSLKFICKIVSNTPIPVPSLIRGTLHQFSVSQKGWPAYLLGNWSMNGWWYYFPIAFLIKNQLSLIVIIIAGTILMVFVKPFRKITLADKYLFLFIPLWFYFMFFSKINIGIRYLLPLFPLAIIFAGKIVGQLWKVNIYARLLLVVLLGWYIFSWIKYYPDALSYSNELTGGPSKTYKYLSDSDNDWGQSLPALKKYLDKNKVNKIYLLSFGYDDPKRYGINYISLPAKNCEKITGYVAISTTPLYNPLYGRERACIDWVKKNGVKLDLVKYAIQIYKVQEPK